MLHDTVGFIELTELPANVVEGTIVYLKTPYDSFVKGHYKFTAGQWELLGGGGSGGGNTTLVPTFRPAIGTVLFNQLDTTDRVPADGGTYSAADYPVLASMLNTGLPEGIVSGYSTGVENGETNDYVTGNVQYMISKPDGNYAISVIDRTTMEVDTYSVSAAYAVVGDHERRALFHAGGRTWMYLNTETGQSTNLGPLLEDLHASGTTGAAVSSMCTLNGVTYVGLRSSNGTYVPRALQTIDTSTPKWGTTSVDVGGNIYAMVGDGDMLYMLVDPDNDGDRVFKTYNVTTQALSTPSLGSIGGSFQDSLAQTEDFVFATARSSGRLVRISKSDYSVTSIATVFGFPSDVYVTGPYVVSTREFYDIETMELVKQYSSVTQMNDTAGPSLLPDGSIVYPGGDPGYEKYGFESFTTPTIAEQHTGVPVLIQAR